MLKSSIIILFFLNVFINNIKFMIFLFFIGMILNIIFNKNLIINLKKIQFLILIYLATFITQIYFHQEGQVFFKLFNVYITKNGVFYFLSNFLRIINMIILSWLINAKKILPKRFNIYQKIIEDVIELVPEALKLFKNRIKIKWFFRYILNQIKIKN